MKKLIITLMLLLMPTQVIAKNDLSADLVFIYALESSMPIYVRETGPPFISSGIRLKLHKEFFDKFYFDINPYIWNAKTDRIGNGGVVARIGINLGNTNVAFVHESRHNFDRQSLGGHLEWDAIELTLKLR